MKDVVIYSTPTCPWCTKVKDYLESKDIDFTDYDVTQDRDKAVEMVNKSGQQGVPVLDIAGDIIVGFNQAKIDELLDL